ncbi:hypothetical protein EDD18DRAFT_1359990 [Armillaria luteobubalina]|uniref:Uncharacterized protein n=1 Tax=Armillaria luteobubalina TaxID=153913 RepID=A0AA39PQX6_9AGAR|nr:hypothetical protein EDD18DRAFT_1359990 [Armillaria luteobubalina]
MHWFYSTTTKTLNDLNCLINKVILAPDFSALDLLSFDANHEAKQLDSDRLPLFATDGLIKDKVMLHLPQTGLLDNIQDIYIKTFGSPTLKELLTFLKCDLMQKIWKLLLDPEFMHTYEHGIVIECADGIFHQVYPQFFTYSADYPENYTEFFLQASNLLAVAFALDAWFSRTGVNSNQQWHDVELVCKWIFTRGYPVSGKRVEGVIGPTSLTPNCNAFSEVLYPLGFNFYQMFVQDLMHKSESGGWKSLFTHLVHICHKIPGAIQKLNKRFCLVPTFGHSTICKFSNDVSGQKKFAARDYEDVLQCSFPCFDGLLPDSQDNKIVIDTVFTWATWHAFAKAQMHMDSSLEVLHGVTTLLGNQLRSFSQNVCPNFCTKELPSETAAQVQQLICTVKTAVTSTGGVFKLIKSFNLKTYKNHALSNYVWCIPKFSTSDSYSTQIGEQEHHHVKLFYSHTNKRGHVKQIAMLEQRKRRLQQILAQWISKLKVKSKMTASPRISPNERDPLPEGQPEDHYQMSLSRSYPLNLHHWLADNDGDLAVEDFIPKLKEHILRLLVNKISTEDEITSEQLSNLHIIDDHIFCHKVL